jgi:hypothetical protein
MFFIVFINAERSRYMKIAEAIFLTAEPATGHFQNIENSH